MRHGPLKHITARSTNTQGSVDNLQERISKISNISSLQPDPKIEKIVGSERLNRLSNHGLPKSIHEFKEPDIKNIKEGASEIGSGGFGAVFCVVNPTATSDSKKLSRTNYDGMPPFPICYKRCHYKDRPAKLYLEYEILVLSELFHKNIVELLGYYHNESEHIYYMVMPYCGVNLYTFMKEELPKYTKKGMEKARAILQINLQAWV